jgi:hypothetical protein
MTILLLLKFICYNFTTSREVCLKVEKFDVINDKKLMLSKNKAVKIKIIPEILIKDLPDLST